MNDYQQKREKQYLLPQTVYRQALYAVKDLNRLRRKLVFLMEESNNVNTMDPSKIWDNNRRVADSTGFLASEIAYTEARIASIESAFMEIPEKYRDGLEDKLVYDVPFSGDFNINTWKKWQQILIYKVAVNLRLF